jgi:hypothetical protein
MPYYSEPEERQFCEHYIPGETLIHTICDRCTKCCDCPKVKTGKQLRQEFDELTKEMGNLLNSIGEGIDKVVSKVEKQAAKKRTKADWQRLEENK